MKKISFLLPFLLLVSFTFAQEIVLKDAINSAFSASTSIKTAQDNLKKAEMDEKTYSAPFYPNVTARLDATILGYDNYGYAITPGFFSPNNYGATVGVTYNFFNMFRDIDKLNYYGKKREEAALELENSKQELAYRITYLYYNVLKAEKTLSIQQDVLRQRNENLKLIAELYKSGVRSKSDFLNSEIYASASEIDVEQAKISMLSIKAELNTELGEIPSKEIKLKDDTEFVKYGTTIEKCYDDAFKNRYDWLKTLKQQEQENIFLSLAERDFYPSISLDGSLTAYLDKYAMDSSTWTHKGNWDQNTSWSISASISYPIFDGWAVSAGIESARAARDIFDQTMERQKRDIRLEVYKKLNDLDVTAFDVESYAKQVLLAKENYDITAARYRTGNASFLDMLNAEVNNNQFRINYYKAICDYKLYKAALAKATGEKLY